LPSQKKTKYIIAITKKQCKIIKTHNIPFKCIFFCCIINYISC